MSPDLSEVPEPEGERVDVRRMRFAAALILFFLWVAALSAMAIFSSHRPEVRHEAAVPH
jgi:hypothetical protein